MDNHSTIVPHCEKTGFLHMQNQNVDQLRSNSEADQRLSFGYMDSVIPFYLNPNFKSLAIFCTCIAWFVSDLVGNPEDQFSHNEAQLKVKSSFCTAKNCWHSFT